MSAHKGFCRLAGVFVVALVLVLGAASIAMAAPAEFTNHTPAPGSAITLVRPLISVRIYDPAGPRPDALWMKIDGRKYGAKVKNVAANTIDYYYTPTTNLASGNHTVEVSELNWAGVRYTTNWSFRVGTPPVLANPSPAPGMTVTTALPLISAKVTQGANGIVPVVMLDGVPIISSFDPGTGLVTATPPSPLMDDLNHDVTVSVTNADGLGANLPWSFYVLTKARMPDTTQDDPCQACHPTFPASHDMTDCNACHGYDGPVGGFYQPPDYHPDGEQLIYLNDCGECHGHSFPTVPDHKSPPESYHRATSASDPCTPCHVKDLLAEHYYRDEVNDCMLCHGSSDANVQSGIEGGNTDCLGCHDADHGGAHESTINEQTLSGSYPGVGNYGPFFCTGCHETGLVTEHAKGSSSSAPAGCDNCHPSPRDTLTPWTQGCVQGGCHPTVSPTASQHGQMSVAHLPLAENADCVGCHNDGDLGALHLNANDGSNSSCFVCHTASGVPEVKNCVTCHPDRVNPHGYEPTDHQSDVGATTVSGTVPTGVAYGPVRCDACHLTELFPEHQRPTSSASSAACDACHPVPVDSLTPAWAKGCVQGGCHAAASTTAQHANMNASHVQPAENASCTVSGCHDQGDLAAVHANSAPVDGCAYCHSTTTVPNIKVCTDCHGTPHGDLAEAHTANEPGGMFWANTGAYAACKQCHYLDVRTEHAKASSGSLGCPACHADGGPIDSLPGGVWNKQCSACHSSIHANYDGEHIAYGQDCNGCHGEPEDARDFHLTCSVAPSDGNTPITPVAPCHVSPDYLPTPQLGPPWTNGYWCRSCHPEE